MANEAELANALFQKLHMIVLGDDSITGTKMPSDSYICFCYPGIAVEASDFDFGFVSPKPGSSMESAVAFADLVNSIPPIAGRFAPSAEKLTDVYRELMRDKQLPTVELTSAEEKRLAAATALIYRPAEVIDDSTGGLRTVLAETPLFEKHRELEAKYREAALAYRSLQMDYVFRDDERSRAEWAVKSSILAGAVDVAYAAWTPVRNQIEAALGTIEALSGRGPEVYWMELENRLRASLRTSPDGQDFYFTKYFPTRFWSPDSKGWTTFKMGASEVHTINENSSTTTSVSGKGRYGLWSASASGSYTEQKSYHKSDTSKLDVAVELTQVAIRRSWLDASVFRNRAWRFDPRVNQSMLSDGEIPAPTGRMPALITGLLLARNLKLGIDMSTEENRSFASQLAVSGSVGWGPFSLRGNYSRNHDRKTHDFVASSAGIEAQGMQIIGFICQFLPKAPNPDQTLNWP